MSLSPSEVLKKKRERGGQASPSTSPGRRRMASPGDVLARRRAGSAAQAPAAPLPELQGPGDIFESVLRDTAEGVVGPFVAAMETGQAILADPAIGLIPAAEQAEHQKKAAEAAWKGAAFWASMAVGGPIANLPMRAVLRMGLAGAASAGAFEGIRKFPHVMDESMKLGDWARDVSIASTFGAFTGGAMSAAGPKVAQLTAKAAGTSSRAVVNAADAVLDRIPGARKIQEKVAGYTRLAHQHLWHPLFTSGQEVLKKAGVPELALKLLETRSLGAMLGGKYVAGFFRNIRGLSADERMMMGEFIEKIDFKNFADDVLAQRVLRMGSPRTQEILQRAWAESERLRMVGEAIQRSGLKTFHPDSGEFHQFLLRDKYLPHRFVNHEKFLEDGPIRRKAIAAVMKAKDFGDEDAAQWVDNFAKRIRDENERFLVDPTSLKTGATHYTIGRNIGLPGYETDIGKILPQYYDSVARRLVAHAAFGPTNSTEQALQKALFQKGKLGERLPDDAPGQQELFATEEMAPQRPQQLDLFDDGRPRGRGEPFREPMGKGLRASPEPAHTPNTLDEIMAARRSAKYKDARQALAIEERYPQAFAQLERITDPKQKQLAYTILKRQLGGVETTPYGEEVLSALAKLEVVSKLALGAIAQPSQMLSAIVRTQWKGSFKNFLKAMSGDVDAMDFAMRSGTILRSIVRESESSLTGGETDFLKRVYFTQMDVKSRVFGALQGASHAEFMAKKLTDYVSKVGTRPFLQKEINKLEEKFVKLGLNPKAIVDRGGHLTEDELLRAAQTVSTDVNFWGDSLSLPAFFRSPYGRFLTQFKSFGFQQSKLMKDHLVKPAMEWVNSGGRRGDIGPLTRFALTMPLGGEAIADLKKFVRGRKRTDVPVERVMENIANAAGFGLGADAVESARHGMAGALGFMGGPIIGTIAKGGTAGINAAFGHPEKLGKFAIETGLPGAAAIVIPGAAPYIAASAPALSNKLMPPEGGK